MNRKSYWSIPALVISTLIFSTVSFLTSCSSNSNTPPAHVVAITANSGGYTTPQLVGSPFGTFSATVTLNGTPASGVNVTFTAPATGASGTFATSTPAATDTEMTNSSGVATSQVFTANTTAGAYSVTATVTGATTPATFALTNTAGAAASLTATGGTPQSVAISTAFASLVAQVTDSDGNPVQGVSVTFTAPATGASGAFTSTTSNTETDTTDANGHATAADFVANATTGGPYNVVASSTGLTSVNFALTNTPPVVIGSNTYVFYLSGEEVINDFSADLPNYYAVAGAVTIDGTGAVTGGEQDYNDAFGNTSPGEPTTPDSITGGTLTADGTTGQYTLTIITNNPNVGASGTETLGVQFVNTNHALVMQFDGSATSSGSMDLQTLSGPSGNFAFTITGVDDTYEPVAFGGVYTAGGGGVAGTLDVNDNGDVITGTAFTGSVGTADAFGRSVVTGISNPSTATAITFATYVVGPEVLRIIDVNDESWGAATSDSAVGSAFGQGAGTFSNASLGTSVLALAGNPYQSQYGTLGQFATSSTSSSPADLTGVGDDNELDNFFVSPLASPFAGTYSIAANGYGTLTITGGLGGGMVSALGIYMTDPTLNLNDPNNTTAGSAVGGALLLDMDDVLAGGTGVVTPQTDPAPADFSGAYAVGWQDFNYFNINCQDCEFDMLAQGSMTAGALSLTGLVSDPFQTLFAGAGLYPGSTFTSTPLADTTNPGRSTMLSTNTTPNPLDADIGGATGSFDVVLYQAGAGQLYWLNYDPSFTTVFVGPLEQQGSLTGLPAARKSTAKTQTKRKP